MLKRQVLLVDDEPINLEILLEYFAEEVSLQPIPAASGEAAWQLLEDPANNFRLILLDRMMPGLDGIELLRRIKASPRLAHIPVIMQTAADSPAAVREGLEAGAYYYLTKPYRHDNMIAIVHAALSDGEARAKLGIQLARHQNCLGQMHSAEFRIRTIEEAGELAVFIAQTCPNPEIAAMGLAELLVNAVEHGNLGLSYQQKAALKQSDTWHSEIARLSALPENQGKRVCMHYLRSPDSITVTISDEGCGFQWADYLEFNPARAFDPNGRGIALARMLSFSDVRYEGCGNTVVATINLSPIGEANA